MIYLNRDKETKELKETEGFKSKKANQLWRIYELNKKEKPFRLSRSKFSDYLTCKRCFYLEQVKGLKNIDTIPFTLNNAVDDLCKKEFDYHRAKQTPHPIMVKNKINAVPFKHKDIERWQNSKSQGVEFVHPDLNLKLAGGIDDVWLNKDTEKLIVVDYKAQSSTYPVTVSSYLDAQWHLSYKLQMDIYVHILRKMNFEVSDMTYFYVCNGEKTNDKFDNKIDFKTTLVPYRVNTSWIEGKIVEMKEVLNLDTPPEIEKTCEKCAYLKGGKNFFK